jgi:hypothetical protein
MASDDVSEAEKPEAEENEGAEPARQIPKPVVIGFSHKEGLLGFYIPERGSE